MTNLGCAARLRGHPSAVKDLRSLRDGLRPPLTAEPLWPLTDSNDGQAQPARGNARRMRVKTRNQLRGVSTVPGDCQRPAQATCLRVTVPDRSDR